MKMKFVTIAVCLVAAGMPTAAQEAGSEKDELIIPVHELTNEEELRERLAEHYGDDMPVDIAPELTRILEAIEDGDDDRLREVLSAIAGAKTLLPSDLPKHDEILRARQVLPTEEVLARMRPEHVEALADHRHLLADRDRLLRALDDLEGIEYSAAMEFITKMRKPERVEDMIPDELREQWHLARERGRYSLPGPAMRS